MGRKPAHLGTKLVILTIIGILLAVWIIQRWPCVLRSISGIPCITCGMSRAWLCALRLDIAGAFGHHPMFWAIPVLILFGLYDGKLFRNPRWNRWSLALLLIGFFASYLIRLVVYLSGESLF